MEESLEKTEHCRITIIWKKSIRGMYIRITRDKEVQVTAPSSVPREEVFRFIEEKKAWIQRNLSRMPETVNYDYHQGELHYFLGKRYVLHFYNSKESWLDLQDRQLMVGVSGRVRNRERLYVRLMKGQPSSYESMDSCDEGCPFRYPY